MEFLADEDRLPVGNMIRLGPPQSTAVTAEETTARSCNDFEHFLADLKAEVEQPLLGALVQDLRAMLSKLKRQARIDADQGGHQIGETSLADD
ncbi:MAG: hypothetical protein V2I51_13305 [Anderseniella sp.]|nr:hypothetical protein [Anderseniella sp.]